MAVAMLGCAEEVSSGSQSCGPSFVLREKYTTAGDPGAGLCRPFRAGLVCGGHFDVVDDEGVDGAFGGLELEAELVFNRSEDGDDVGASLLGGDVVGPFESDGGVAGEAGLVDHFAVDLIGEGGGQVGHGGAFAGKDET